jgi:hypothetical protein
MKIANCGTNKQERVGKSPSGVDDGTLTEDEDEDDDENEDDLGYGLLVSQKRMVLAWGLWGSVSRTLR